jgi:hypothetical protein
MDASISAVKQNWRASFMPMAQKNYVNQVRAKGFLFAQKRGTYKTHRNSLHQI